MISLNIDDPWPTTKRGPVRARWGTWLMMKIRLLKDGQVVESFDARWTIDIADIADSAAELGPECGADEWEVVNEAGNSILTKTRWKTIRR
jgi:hypothetical protein